ncbi:MAG: hypothetical protein COV91_05270 [Candidatus Taylorbacteria bacterium CG11_big_fil_rev_8_21_14_0_20_46_11]|uniref:Uncharacterized protein n=1 Tax=Candidatus Taylorbacteria bacterium CG11_big_fil_rev_8_21_14_0_20_46_11 TaxID=1975025 RepID=A0A2H0KAD3_9BACT|nr:MAG: hypothetical protein COV91_05270 [Candidatus Taylorbacteria bacterium CG11_big_fil_rev_8_21_14_0_20_46_11]
MISTEALQTILGIVKKVHLTPEEMADTLNLTFFPYDEKKLSPHILSFRDKLDASLRRLKVNLVPFEEAQVRVPLTQIATRAFKILANNALFLIEKVLHLDKGRHFIHFEALLNLLKLKRVKRGISVIALGEHEIRKLPIDFTSSFSESQVISIVDWPEHISAETDFHTHFDTAMGLFAKHMANIVIPVSDKRWMVYNFNASHPIYAFDDSFDRHVLHTLIPKIAAPIRPVRFSDMVVEESQFDPLDSAHKAFVQDFLDSGKIFHDTGIFPKGKAVSDLPFRTGFYKWIGTIHLDHRNGMSYGFLARQLPTTLPRLIPLEDFRKEHPSLELTAKDYVFVGTQLYIIIEITPGRKVCIHVPTVSVLSQRSGSDKTKLEPKKDLLMLGLKDGKLHMQTPKGLTGLKHYRPSFDTRVILAHAVGNALVAAILKDKDPHNVFAKQIEQKGCAIVHWHGYIAQGVLPAGWHTHGNNRPHVACSSPQSAMYALAGKLEAFQTAVTSDALYLGDVHIEPHHGTNLNFPTLIETATFFMNNSDATTLGNKHLGVYNVE